MKLDVIQSEPKLWYEQGLNFTCQQCGNCCTGGPGYVWVSQEEVARLAEFLGLSERQVIKQYCRKVEGRLSLKEVRRGALYDCVFLKEQRAEVGAGDHLTQSRLVCTVYPVRPLQCRTWPFWDGNLRSEQSWQCAAKGCYGMNQGRKFTREQIVSLRDAKDWPERPPTSRE